MKGEYEMPEISNDVDDGGDDYEVLTTFKEDKGQLKARYGDIVRKEAPKELRKAIKDQYVSELKQK